MTESMKSDSSLSRTRGSRDSKASSVRSSGRKTRYSKSSISLRSSQVSTPQQRIPPEKESDDSAVVEQKYPESCDCGPDLYSRVLGPTADETILTGLQTVIDLCSKLRSCTEKEEVTDEEPERDSITDSDIPERDTTGQSQADESTSKSETSETDHGILSSQSQTDPNRGSSRTSQTYPRGLLTSKSQTDSQGLTAAKSQTDSHGLITSKSQTDSQGLMTSNSQTDSMGLTTSKSQTDPRNIRSSISQTLKNMVSAGFQVSPSLRSAEVQAALYPDMVSEILQTIGLDPEMASHIVQTSFMNLDEPEKPLLIPKKNSLVSMFMQTTNPSLYSASMQTSSPALLPGASQTNAIPADTGDHRQRPSIASNATQSDSTGTSTTGAQHRSRSVSQSTQKTLNGDQATIVDEHSCISPPELPQRTKVCKCCKCSSTSLRRGSDTNRVSSSKACVCCGRRRSSRGSRSSVSIVGDREKPEEIRYAVTRISKYKDFSTFEVMRSTRKLPRQIPKSVEGVFVLRKDKKKDHYKNGNNDVISRRERESLRSNGQRDTLSNKENENVVS